MSGGSQIKCFKFSWHLCRQDTSEMLYLKAFSMLLFEEMPGIFKELEETL